MRFGGNKFFLVLASVQVGANEFETVEHGIDLLESSGFASVKNNELDWTEDLSRFKGKRSQYLLY